MRDLNNCSLLVASCLIKLLNFICFKTTNGGISCLVLSEFPRPHSMGKEGLSVFQGFFLLVHYNVASAEFPSSSDQEAMQKCVSVAG